MIEILKGKINVNCYVVLIFKFFLISYTSLLIVVAVVARKGKIFKELKKN